MKKRIAIIMMIVVMMFSLCVPVHANGSGSFELHSTVESVYAGTLCTVSYYHPAEFPNVWVGFASYGGGYSDGGDLFVIYYKDGTTFACANTGITFNQEVLIAKVTSVAAMEDILFNGAVADYIKTTSGGPKWSNSLIFQDTDPAMRQNGTPKSLEAYYYDYYFENNGVYPVGISIRLDFMCNGEIIETQVTETIAGNTILLQDIIQEPDGYAWETININGTEYQKADSFRFTQDTDIAIIVTKTAGVGDAGGIIATLQQIGDSILEWLQPPEVGFFEIIANRLHETLEDDEFYNGLISITYNLAEIFAQDYNSKEAFKRINPIKITLRKVPIPSADGQSYSYSEIDWGLQDASVFNLDWFLGNHPYAVGVNIDGSPAPKQITDTLVSAFLWIVFAFNLWKSLPDIVSGEMSNVTAISHEMDRRTDTVYMNSTIDQNGNQKYTKTIRRRIKR